MKIFGSIFSLLLIAQLALSKNIDSLEKELSRNIPDSVEVNIYYSLLLAYEYSEPQKALFYVKKMLDHPIHQTPYYQARGKIQAGRLYKNLGQFDSAVVYMLDGITIADQENDYKNQAIGYNSLGVIYKANSDWDNALKYYKLAYAACTKYNFVNGIAMTLNNIGTIHDALENRDSAIIYYERAVNIAEENDLIGAKAVSYNNLGEILAKEGKEDEALPYFYKTLTCDSLTNNLHGMSYTLFNIVTSLKVLGRQEEAFSVLKQAEQVAKKIKSTQIDLLYQRSLSDMLEHKGDYKAALEAHKRFKALNDSVYNAQKSEQIAEMQTKYETEKKELEIRNLSQENEIKTLDLQRKNTLLLGTAAMVILIVLLAFVFVKQLRTKQKHDLTKGILAEREKGIAALFKGIEEERKRIAQDLHDGIG